MIRVQETAVIACSPDTLLDFVMDIERYAEVDRKISPVLWHRREGNVVEFACRPTLAGMPQPKVVQQLTLTPGQRIDISLSPPPQNRIGHAMARFAASFQTEAVPEGTRVTRTLEFRVTPALRWLLEPLLRRRLPGEVREELRLAKRYLERA